MELKPSGCVVLASGGYPLKYETGKLIAGLEEVAKVPGLVIFRPEPAWLMVISIPVAAGF